MSEFDPDAGHRGVHGAPAQPPGPVPEGFVPVRTVSPFGPAPHVDPPVAPAGGTVVPFPDDPAVPPRTKSQAGRWLFYAVIGFVVGQLMGAVFGTVAGSVAGKNAAQMAIITAANVPPEWYVVSTLLGLWIGFVGAPWLASRTQGTRHFLADLGVRFKVADLLGLAIGLGGQLLIVLIYLPFRSHIHNFNAPSQKLTGASHGGGFLITALALVVFAPFAEELFFRGLLFKALVRLFAPLGHAKGARAVAVVAAVVVDGLLFGLAHGELVQLAGLAVFGVILATVSYRTGRLGMNMVSHASFNLVAVLAILSQRAHS